MRNYKYFISASNKFLTYKFYIDIIKKGDVDLYKKQIIYPEYLFFLGKFSKAIYLSTDKSIKLKQVPKEIVLAMLITCKI